MKRRPGQLAEYDAAHGQMFVESMRYLNSNHDEAFTPPPEPDFRTWIDGELATLIARNPDGAPARMAASEVRRREAWQTPAKWALFLSGVSILISAAALVVALNR